MTKEEYMAITFIQGHPPIYQFSNGDITSGSWLSDGIANVSYIGAIAVNTDTGAFYRITAKNTVQKVAESVATPNVVVDSNFSGVVWVSGS